MACTIANDLEFGPAVQGCRDNFDFTLTFENDILTIVPCCLFLLVTAILLPRRMRRPLRTISPAPQWTKLIVAVVHAGINLAILVLWHTTSLSPINIAGPALAFVSSAAAIIVSHFEHTRTVRPSTLLILFMGTLALFNAVKTRTLFLGGFSHPIAGFTASLVFLELLYVVVESRNKRNLLRFPWKAEPAEALDGILQRTVFSWILPIFLQGFRSVLTINDLYSLDNRMTSLVRGRKHIDAWQKVNKQKKYALVWATFWALLKPLLFTIPPRIALIGFRFAQPFLINAVLTELLQPELSLNNMYGLIGASALVYIGLAFSTVLYQQKLNFVTTALRGGMVALIYEHTLRIPESKAIDSAAITHMSTDVERVAGSFGQIMEVWGQTAEVAIGIWLLSIQIGWICVAPILIVVISTVSTTYIMRSVGRKQKIWVKAIQERVTFTLNSIKSIKAIKMMGYSTRVTQLIQDLRVHELEQMRAFRSFSIVRSLFAMGPRIFGPFVTYIIYAIIAHYTDSPPLQTAQAFTSLAIISLVTNPAFALLSSMGIVSQALGCFSRIAGYLKLEVVGPSVELMHPTKTQQFAIPTGSARSHSYADDPQGNTQSGLTGEKQISLSSRLVVSDLTKSMALDIERVAVRYNNQVSRTLNGVSLAVPKKSLTIILGPSGCGKTTLLNAILGELECEEGIIFRPMSMGFSGQDEWLPSGTLKALISGSSTSTRADEANPWLDKVIWACELDDLVNELPFGLSTQFNMQAMTLSGGQRQRIALARAIYSRSELLLLDDVLSALDNRTELIILERLFGPDGLFQTLDTTVVLVTHSPRPLRFAQKIIHMTKTGSIDFDGDYRSALKNSTVAALIKQFEQSGPRPPPPKGIGNDKLAKAAAIAKPPSNNDIMDLRRQAGDVTVYKYYFSSVRARWLVLFFIQMGLFTVFVQIQQIWLAWYASGTITSLALFCSIYALFAIGSLAALAASLALFFFQILPESANNLHERLLLAVMHSPFSFFVETDAGITLNRFSQDMTLIDGSLPLSAIGVLTSSFDCIAALVFVSLGSNYLALVVVPLVILLYGLQKFYLRTSRQIRFLDLEAKSPLYSQFLETLPGLSTIRALRWQDEFMKDHLHRLDNSQKPYYLLFCIQRWLNLVLDLAVGGMGVLVIVLSLLVRSSSAGPAFVGVALNAILGFNSSLASVMAGWINLETSLGAVARTKQFAESAVKEDRPGEVVQPAEHWSEDAVISLQHFTASYATSKDELKRNTVLHDLSLNIPARHKLGICGKTGSGKSSVLLALLRILEPTSGTVSIGNTEFTQMPREILRQTLISIPQETLVLPGSVRFNLDPEGKYSDEVIQAALSKCLLWTTISTNGGLDGTIHGLSKGQQQLFSIARAMLKKSDAPNGGVLLLDEATSHLDSETDRAIQKVLLEEFKSYTVLCVSHRLETLLDLETVIVMEKGEIVESGNPRALMADRNSALSRLRDGQ